LVHACDVEEAVNEQGFWLRQQAEQFDEDVGWERASHKWDVFLAQLSRLYTGGLSVGGAED
jgi:hypothetical protein